MPNSARQTRNAVQRGRKCRGQLEDGEGDNVEHQGGSAAVALRHRAKQQSANGAHDQRPEDGLGNLFYTHVEVRGDRLQAEGEQKKVEGIQRPAQKAGNEGVVLDASERAYLME